MGPSQGLDAQIDKIDQDQVFSRYWQKGYTDIPELLSRVLEPADSWEKTSGSSAVNEEKINTAFSDPSLYEVKRRESETEVADTQEKRTEL